MNGSVILNSAEMYLYIIVYLHCALPNNAFVNIRMTKYYTNISPLHI